MSFILKATFTCVHGVKSPSGALGGMLEPAVDTPRCSVPRLSLVLSVPAAAEAAGPMWRLRPRGQCACGCLLKVFSRSWGSGARSAHSFWFMSWSRVSHGARSAFSCGYNGQLTQTLHGESKNDLKWLKCSNMFCF